MTQNANRNMWFGGHTIILTAALAGLLTVSPSSAQERRRPVAGYAPAPPPTTLPANTERFIQVFRLKYADPNAAAQAVATAGAATVTVDQRSNSLVVAAPAEAMEKVKRLLSELDVTQEQRPGQQIRILTVTNADPRTAARALQETFGREVQIIPESATRALIIRAEPTTFDRITEVLKALDVPTAQTPRETVEVRVLTPKYTSAGSAAATLSAILGDGCKVVAQDSTNSVIVKGTPTAIEECEELLAKLDREPAAPAEPSVRIFQIANRKLDDGIRQAVALLLGDRGSVAFDERTNSVIVKGDRGLLDMAAQAVAHLDKPVAAPPAGAESAVLPSVRIRLVWLAQGLKAATGEFPSPPPDLSGVVEEMARIGVKDLRLVAQTVVGSVGEGKFRLTAAPEFADADNCLLKLEGDVRPDKAAPQIRLRLSAAGFVRPPEPAGPGPQPPRPRSQVEFGDIETIVAAPLGHAVVLGMTPTLKATSVFVIQLLPSD